MIHEPQTTLASLATQAAIKFADVEANAGLVREEFLTLAIQANNEALLLDELPSPTELLSEWFAKTLDRQAKSRQAHLKKSLAGIQSSLDLGADYDSVVLICGSRVLDATAGRITTLGLLNANDLVLMDRESEANMRKIVAAHEKQHEGVIRAVPTLRQFRDYRSFCERVQSA